MRNAAVIGGGISGMLSSLLLAEAGWQVTLVESSPHLGGLLRSYSHDDLHFDYGTHLLKKTGIENLDQKLYPDLSEAKWNQFNILKNGNFFKGKLNDHSPFIDSRLLSADRYEKAVDELLSITTIPENASNLKQQLIQTYGVTFYQEIFEPILQKFFHVSPELLAPHSQALVGLGLILIKDAEATRQLKQNEIFNRRIGFHSFAEGVSSLTNYYPKTGGIGQWISSFEQRLKQAGVTIMLDTTVTGCQFQEHKVTKFKLSNNEAITCDEVVWSIPPVLFLKAANIPVSSTRPTLLFTSLFHFLADSPPLTDLYYLVNFEIDSPIFRVTLYSNLQQSKQYKVTVECLSRESVDLKDYEDKIKQELVRMKIFIAGTEFKTVHSEILTSGFPVPSLELQNNSKVILTKAKDAAQNLTFTGKNNGSTFFLNHVLVDTFEQTNKLIKKWP